MKANIHITVESKESISFLKDVYFNSPFKVADIREDKKDKTLQLMLMSSSPGILDGDLYNIDIDLKGSSSLQLNTQSYLRIYSMSNSASQNFAVRMSSNCTFHYLPHPTVPHKNSNFTTSNKIHLSDDCLLIWGDILTCGRKLNEEEFQFTKFQSITELYMHERLIFKDNFLIEPSLCNYNGIGQMEGFTHQANYIYINDRDLSWKGSEYQRQMGMKVLEYLSSQDSIIYGLTALQYCGLSLRILGYKAEQLQKTLQEVTNILYKQ
jgi:urease accessory protein